jgi:crossover junction endodeoxyribonuclease RuvC
VGSTARRVQRLQGMPVAQRILGVDPGLHITGYGVIELVARNRVLEPQLVEGGTVRARESDAFPLRLQTLFDGLSEVLREHNPDVVVIEELFSTYAHPRSALLMAHARGVLMLAAQIHNVPVHGFTPNEVKQVVAGNGHATKSNVQAAVKTRLKLASAPHPPDVADALAIALCFAARQNLDSKQ